MLRLLVLISTLFLASFTAFASSLYNAEVPVEDSDTATELAAKQQAMLEVLVRVSGQSEITENPVVKKSLGSVDTFISSVGYGEKNEQKTLIAGFESSKIRALLIQADATFWGEPRPYVLFWLVEDGANGRNVIWEQSENDMVSVLKAEGERRGLPILVPVGDFDDVVNVSVPDIWGGFVNPLSDVSERYNPDGVVLVKIRRNRLSWQLYPKFADMKYSAPVSGSESGEINAMLNSVVDQIADQYASRTAVSLGNDATNTTLLSVSGLQSSEDYFALERTLKGLNSIASMELETLSKELVTYRISLLSSEDVFNNELTVDRRIRKQDADTEIVDGNVVPLRLNYRWQGIAKLPVPAPVTTETVQDGTSSTEIATEVATEGTEQDIQSTEVVDNGGDDSQ
ncbi:hypothetical protein CS022_21005 [Veronia nyctiphanis]|uniref:DUF2066 domain-containing protein n=1 Tax=Veronia nyctiphanis TaxID=1278244 RepID=A0A4Q0YL11_9GAMM|nr:DUF2066 domain-containing protein [Veronia nyctiphanis]RXJ71457.1 hypothetical protein CS022_21005 [Veronia nyctiphanis]